MQSPFRHLLFLLALGALTAPGLGRSPAPSGPGIRLATVAVHDPMIHNMKAFSLLVPKGWRHQAEVQWRHQYNNLVSASIVVANPADAEQLQVYPVIPFIWVANPVMPMQVGSNYLGGEVRPPIQDPAQLVAQMILPAFRRGIGNVRVIGNKALPQAAREVHRSYYNDDPNTRIHASRWHIRYDAGGQAYEEAFHCAVSYTTNPMVPGNVIWKPEFIYSFRAAEGGLEAVEGLLQAVVSSFSLDLQWFGQYLSVVKLQQQGQMQAIRSAGELSRYISGVNNEINDIITGSWKNQQAGQDRIYSRFSEHIRGVETYDNPVTGRTVQLPSDYRHAWVSSGGEYFLSQGEVDPNVGSTTTWQRMSAAR